MPFGRNHRYDLVVDLGDRFVTVQCKTGRLRKGRIVFNARSTRVNSKGFHSRDYRGQVDAFAVFCPDTDAVYVVTVDESTSSDVCLRVEPTANGQAKGVRWASDHELA